MSIFEAGMLICFGLAWPINIYKSIKTKSTKEKSLAFQIVVMVGYVSGIIHKAIYSPDIVMYLYILNLSMVAFDTMLFFWNRRSDCNRER